MKQKLLTMAATVAALMVMTVVTANAQAGAKLKAHVPFDFAAGQTRLRAGDYSVTRIARNAFLLRSADNKTSVIVQAPVAIEPGREGSPARLVFKRYDQEYFLTQVWTYASAEGRQLNTSRTEARLAGQWAQKNTPAQIVEVLARAK
ncbi:MAG TPA: hypothetical protein VKD91_21885 [Pyrinomonadaceae bacterium]|nr:hypothetical protein [Pyrinomonadaceae bacterium]